MFTAVAAASRRSGSSSTVKCVDGSVRTVWAGTGRGTGGPRNVGSYPASTVLTWGPYRLTCSCAPRGCVDHDAPVDVLLRDGRVAAVGAVARRARAHRATLDGRWLMPGLWDAHVHLTQWALARRRLDVSGATSAAHAAALVAARAAARCPAPRSSGSASATGCGPTSRPPRCSTRPSATCRVVLVSGDLHCAWASTAGLRFLGVGHHPTGLLREPEWLPLQGVVDHVPDDVADALVDDATRGRGGARGRRRRRPGDRRQPRRLASSRRARPGRLRVRAGVWEEYLDRVVREDLHTGDLVGGLVEQGPLKVITDGSLNTRTAYCHDPYPGLTGPNARGVLAVPPVAARPAHGARAPGTACAARSTRSATPRTPSRSTRSPPPAPPGRSSTRSWCPGTTSQRFAALGVVASVQPEHAMDDRDVADHHWAGPHRPGVRVRRAAPGGRAAGARLRRARGAPGPVDRARRRRHPVPRRPEPWHPEQALDRRVALESSVDGRGLAPVVGAPADLVVLDADPLTAPLRGMPVAGTLVAGDWTHRGF